MARMTRVRPWNFGRWQMGAVVDTGHLFHHLPGRTIVGEGIGERRQHAGSLAVAVGLGQLTIDLVVLTLLQFSRTVAQHEMRDVERPFVRRHIGAFGHEAQITERAGVDDLLIVGGGDAGHFIGTCIHEIEQARE
jgi:hypothetical protein